MKMLDAYGIADALRRDLLPLLSEAGRVVLSSPLEEGIPSLRSTSASNSPCWMGSGFRNPFWRRLGSCWMIPPSTLTCAPRPWHGVLSSVPVTQPIATSTDQVAAARAARYRPWGRRSVEGARWLRTPLCGAPPAGHSDARAGSAALSRTVPHRAVRREWACWWPATPCVRRAPGAPR